MRRPLADTLLDLTHGLEPAPELVPWVRVTRLTLDLPLEIALLTSPGEPEFLANPPRWRWRTPFDETPSRLRITWEEVARI
jgi:hypothetical protein